MRPGTHIERASVNEKKQQQYSNVFQAKVSGTISFDFLIAPLIPMEAMLCNGIQNQYPQSKLIEQVCKTLQE
jgi:hypothetical protein